MAATVIIPLPTAVGRLMGVVQNATAQRRMGASRIVFDRPRQQVIKAGKALRAVDEINDRLGLLLVHAGRDVDHHQTANQVRMSSCEFHAREPTERHPDNRDCMGRELRHNNGEVVGEVHRCVRAVLTPTRVSVTSKVNSHQGDTEVERDRVPRVCILGAAVHQHELRIARTPHQRADVTSRRGGGIDLDVDSTNLRWRVERERVLRRVFVEEGEFVVGQGGHTHIVTRELYGPDVEVVVVAGVVAGAVVVDVVVVVVVGTGFGTVTGVGGIVAGAAMVVVVLVVVVALGSL